MKHMVFLSLIVCLCGCGNPNNSAKNNAAPVIGREFAANDLEKFVKDIKESEAIPAESRGLPDEELSFAQLFARCLDKYTLTICDYYQIDLERFYANPSEENLQACMTPRTDVVYILAWEQGVLRSRLLAKKNESSGTWTLYVVTPNFGKVLSWLVEDARKADLKNIRIFSDGSSRDFVSYEKGGETYYFKVTGKPYTPAELTEYYVNSYNQLLRDKPYIEKIFKRQ